MSALRVFLDVPKNPSGREHLRVALDEFKGHELVDIRVTVQLSESSGVRTPTSKGVAFNRELLPQVLGALMQAHQSHFGRPYEAPEAQEAAA